VKLGTGEVAKFKSSQFYAMWHFIGAVSLAVSYSFKPENKIEISFGPYNKFEITLGDEISYEDRNLLDAVFYGTLYGVNFVSGDIDTKNYREKTFKLKTEGGKKIIETSDGIKLYVDSIHPNNSIIECFVNKVHMIKSTDDWTNKTVIDVGAECGDTALYYSSLGATVFSLEPIKDNYDAMIRNIGLNPNLSKRIVPINAALGTDGTVKFFQNPNKSGIASSFVYNEFGKDALISEIKSYSLKSFLKEFDIKHVDMLKMDCKGCEKYLTEKALEQVDRVKIEYDGVFYGAYKLEDLLSMLKKAGFDCVLYRISPFYYQSIKLTGHIYGKRVGVE
jgi:FkbM family methyltransferase